MFREARRGRHCPLVLSLVLAATRALGQAPVVPPAAERPARPPDFKIAFWYLRSDPLNTFRHRTYDVRRGQYTRAVEDWLRAMKRDHRDYEAYIKDVRLEPDIGQGAEKQLATLILQEHLDRAGPNGGFGLRDPYGIYGGVGLGDLLRPRTAVVLPGIGRRDDVGLYSRGYGFVQSPGANQPPSFLLPPAQGPFLYPYVRPHP
jgi:hypothetical protein